PEPAAIADLWAAYVFVAKWPRRNSLWYRCVGAGAPAHDPPGVSAGCGHGRNRHRLDPGDSRHSVIAAAWTGDARDCGRCRAVGSPVQLGAPSLAPTRAARRCGRTLRGCDSIAHRVELSGYRLGDRVGCRVVDQPGDRLTRDPGCHDRAATTLGWPGRRDWVAGVGIGGRRPAGLQHRTVARRRSAVTRPPAAALPWPRTQAGTLAPALCARQPP